LRTCRFNGQSRRITGTQGIQGRHAGGTEGGHCKRINKKTIAATIRTVTT